jgi:hypothetical protein
VTYPFGLEAQVWLYDRRAPQRLAEFLQNRIPTRIAELPELIEHAHSGQALFADQAADERLKRVELRRPRRMRLLRLALEDRTRRLGVDLERPRDCLGLLALAL